MKYAMTQWIFGGEPLETTLQRLKRHGFDGIELNPDPDCLKDTKEVRRLLDKFEIEPSVIDLTPFHDLSHPDKAERDKAMDVNRTILRIAKEIGCGMMGVCGTAVGRIRAVDTYEAEWRFAVESVRTLADYAAGLGVRFVIEVINHYETCMLYNVDRSLRFMADVDHENLAVMVDTYHMNIEENDPCRAIRRVADKLVNFHISDSNRWGVGHGHIDFIPIIKTLKEIDYDGYIALEPQAPGPDPFEAVKTDDSRQIVDDHLKQSIDVLRAIEAAV